MSKLARWKDAVRKLQWKRGLRAGVAVAAAMTMCHVLGLPIGWAALGAFEAILVDNGGPYRSRLMTITTLMVGGAAACVVGSVSSTPLMLAILVTAAFCFATTFARVISQPIASTSVIVLVLYFAGFGGANHSLSGALSEALQFVMGGAWAALFSLMLWPVDPFRPARLAVAQCYELLANFTAEVKATAPRSEERDAERARMFQLQRTMRLKMEESRKALETTAARTTSRTVRARSLTTLLETADMLFARTIRWTELVEAAEDEASQRPVVEALHWLSGAERAVSAGLRERPADGGASFAPEGSHSLEHVLRRSEVIARYEHAGSAVLAHLAADEADALQNVEIAFESVRAVWTGVDVSSKGIAGRAAPANAQQAETTLAAGIAMRWTETVRANWTAQSVMMRHALRLAVVGAADVVVMWAMHIAHGSWLGMTSVIVLQPYGSGTLRKTVQRVGGTIAGGVLAAVLAASIHSQMGIMVVITVTSVLTLATYAVNYAWYSFFLTPTFVLMSLPHLRDWHFAGVRIELTVVGALIAVLAMRLLWPEQEEIALNRLLGRGAAADAAYVEAMVAYWGKSAGEKARADRDLLAPARRRSGLAVADAQETLDRLLLEPTIGWRTRNGSSADSGSARESALTFVTYLQRFARAVTTLAVVGSASESSVRRVEAVERRLKELSRVLLADGAVRSADEDEPPAVIAEGAESSIAEQQIRRMERQVGVMERAAAGLARPE